MEEPKRKPGRPPSQKARVAIFKTTMELLLEHGLRKMTIDKVAEQAGVSKATIYRWWSDKVELAMEAFVYHVQIEGTITNTGNVVDDYIDWFMKLHRFYVCPEGRVLAQIMAESQSRQEMLLPFHKRLREMMYTKCLTIWNRALERGELDETIDAMIMIELLHAPSSYRMLSNQPPMDDDTTAEMVRLVFCGIKKQ
ncbi:TetR/AcrR family transcriptional regulator [Paenibacillus campi]|uniref:TetR/AcrR family transcriptional regulator n=1 Tax=Paenibacillus campi TaxID=3106031 RepID=UPI002AFF6D1E|nr:MULTISPECIES: TetR/AcrR family transcriptional regulator [unclassified Paenibacillus]